jgi:hypothetical protein
MDWYRVYGLLGSPASHGLETGPGPVCTGIKLVASSSEGTAYTRRSQWSPPSHFSDSAYIYTSNINLKFQGESRRCCGSLSHQPSLVEK